MVGYGLAVEYYLHRLVEVHHLVVEANGQVLVVALFNGHSVALIRSAHLLVA